MLGLGVKPSPRPGAIVQFVGHARCPSALRVEALDVDFRWRTARQRADSGDEKRALGRRGNFLKFRGARTDTDFVSTHASSGNGRNEWPGARRWHASLPTLAATLTCLALVATVAFAGFAARQLALASERQTAVLHLREQLTGATEHLERANRLLAATAKVVQAASQVQDIDQAIAQQRSMAQALEKTTRDAIALAKADKTLKAGMRDKAIAKLNAEMKAQLAGFASKEKELSDQRQPLAERLSEELGRMLATFADEAAKAAAKNAPEAAAPEKSADAGVAPAASEKPNDTTGATDSSPPPEEARVPADAGGKPESGASAAPEDGAKMDPSSETSAVRPSRDGTATGIGSGKQVEP